MAMTIEQAYNLYASEMIGYARRWWSKDEAEDIVHDVFVKMLSTYADQDQPRGWLFVALKNRIIDRARREARTARNYPIAMSYQVTSIDPAAIALARAQAQELLNNAPITDKSRRAVVLAYGYDITFQEIADALGSNRRAIKQQAMRGLDALRTGKPSRL